jgi:hypothetical protein
MTEERWAVPQSWAWESIGDIAGVVGGGTPDSNDAANFCVAGIRWLTPADLNRLVPAQVYSVRQGDVIFKMTVAVAVDTRLWVSSCSALSGANGLWLSSMRLISPEQ